MINIIVKYLILDDSADNQSSKEIPFLKNKESKIDFLFVSQNSFLML